MNCNEGYLIFGRYLEILVSYYFRANPSSEDYELFLSQVDYKRLSQDLSKIVNMKGKISLGPFVAPVKRGGKCPTFLTRGSSTKKPLTSHLQRHFDFSIVAKFLPEFFATLSVVLGLCPN